MAQWAVEEIERLTAELAQLRESGAQHRLLCTKDHDKARLVGELAEIARQYHDTQQLRQQIANVVLPALKSPDPHELWAAAQLAPGECVEDGVARIRALLDAPIRAL